ncbi:MAG: transglycosylase SLT domain-containing protein [Nitrospirae bacterium]|nr:transglycosylase SLT domain-containing protein [Nitrospirota bacterium]
MSRHITTLIILLLMYICLFPLGSDASDIKSEEVAGPAEQVEKAVRASSAPLNKETEKILLDEIQNDLPGKDQALFILGRLYKESGNTEKAGDYLIKAAEAYPVLKDYALKLLTDIYLDSKKYEEAVRTARQINNSLLLPYAGQSEITALMALNREDEAGAALVNYIERYPRDWDRKLSLARLLKKKGETAGAVGLLKNIYLNATPLSQEALGELRQLKADRFTGKDLLERAANLYKNNNYKRAESTYKEALGIVADIERDETMLLIGRCQFMQKHYGEAAKTFERIKTPEGMYWLAQVFYRRNDEGGFERVKKEFELAYPENHLLALLFLMDADELRRKGRSGEAESNYRSVLDRFPERAEDALWGLGWLSYISGNYKNANDYFSRLSSYANSKDYYKYLFWRARSQEKLAEKCSTASADRAAESDDDICKLKDRDFFRGLPSNESYYGYLIKLRSSDHAPEKIELNGPVQPEGDVYERIAVLSFLGMKSEALAEILDSFNKAQTLQESLYLSHMALKLEAYKEVIAFAEPKNDRELLPYSYPPAYWDTVRRAADSNNLDAFLIAALIREESRFDPDVVSWAGAVGLMQLMPSTANSLKKEIKISLKDRSQLKDPQKNILLGSYYLSQLISEFKELPLAIAAYNAGKYKLRQWMSRFNSEDLAEFTENIPYKETRKYVQRVLKSYWQYRAVNGLPVSNSGLIAER